MLESIIMPQSDKIKLSLALSINDFCIQLHIESINKNNDVKTQLNTDWFKVVDQYNQLKRTIPVSQQHEIEKAWISLSPKISGYLLSLSNSKW